MQALHILVEHIGCEQIGQEVKAHEHEEHEQQRIEEVNVHGGEEHIWEVGSCEKNCHVLVCITDRAEVLEALKRRPVEVVDGEYEEQDVSEDRQQDSKRVPQVTEQTVDTLAESVLESKQHNYAHKVGKVRVLHAEVAASEVNDRDEDCDEQDSRGFLLVLGLIAPVALDEGHEDEGDHANDINQDGDHWRESWKGRVADTDVIVHGNSIAIKKTEMAIVQSVVVIETPGWCLAERHDQEVEEDKDCLHSIEVLPSLLSKCVLAFISNACHLLERVVERNQDCKLACIQIGLPTACVVINLRVSIGELRR